MTDEPLLLPQQEALLGTTYPARTLISAPAEPLTPRQRKRMHDALAYLSTFRSVTSTQVVAVPPCPECACAGPERFSLIEAIRRAAPSVSPAARKKGQRR